MDTKNRILNRGGFFAALICLFVSACGPNGGTDSGPMTDAGMPPGDSGPDMPDAYVPPDEDGGTDPDAGTDSGTVPACSPAEVASRTPGCGEQYDLPSGMSYDDSAMPVECMTELMASTWSYAGGSGCSGDLFREDGTNQWMFNLGCQGDLPYDGIYRLGADGTWYGNYGNASMAGEAGNHGHLMPTSSCRTLNGEFYRGGETVPYRTNVFTRE